MCHNCFYLLPKITRVYIKQQTQHITHQNYALHCGVCVAYRPHYRECRLVQMLFLTKNFFLLPFKNFTSYLIFPQLNKRRIKHDRSCGEGTQQPKKFQKSGIRQIKGIRKKVHQNIQILYKLGITCRGFSRKLIRFFFRTPCISLTISITF